MTNKKIEKPILDRGVEGVIPPYPYEGGFAKFRDAELSEASLKALRELEEGKVELYSRTSCKGGERHDEQGN